MNNKNKHKFKIVPVTVRIKNDVIVDGNEIEYSDSGRTLETTIRRTGTSKHLNEIKHKAYAAL